MKQNVLMLALSLLLQTGAGLAYNDDDEVTLQSSDGDDFKVLVKVAKKSETVKNLIEDAGIDTAIPLPIVNTRALHKIVEIMKWCVEHPFDLQREAESNQQMFNYLLDSFSSASIDEVFEVVSSLNYLDITWARANDLLFLSLRIYGKYIFSDVELQKLSKPDLSAADIKSYSTRYFAPLPVNLRRFLITASLPVGIDRIFLDSSLDRRINTTKSILESEEPLGILRTIAYISRNQVKSAERLPEALKTVLKDWLGKDFATHIVFGPWPIEWATWPGHCPLPSDANYNMYSDKTPNDRFVDNGDGTVTDVCTLLTWDKEPSPQLPWESAIDYCKKLNLEPSAKKRKTKHSSKEDESQLAWRAPTRIELQSIVNYAARNPALNPVFENGKAKFWSSTPAVGRLQFDEIAAWSVNFEDGSIMRFGNSAKHRVRCVKGERDGAHILKTKDRYAYFGTGNYVTDYFTGAQWQRSSVDSARSHTQARDDCKKLMKDAQLPTIKLLSTIVDVAREKPSLDPEPFPGKIGGYFWSSTLHSDDSNFAWYINFDVGLAFGHHVYTGNSVRCVTWN